MITVYGASDDLIAIDGDIYEEFTYVGKPSYLAFSDGTLLRVEYDSEGMWRLNRLGPEGLLDYKKEEATGDEGKRPNGLPAYSDVVTLDGTVGDAWVVYGLQKARSQGRVSEEA